MVMPLLDHGFTRKEDLVLRKVAGETILVPVRSSAAGLESVYTMNDVGGEIWSLLDGRAGHDVVRELCELYEADPDSVTRDVESFLTDLQEAGLVDAAAAPRQQERG